MTKLILVLPLVLGACATLPQSAAVPVTKADRAVARASTELARYCSLTQAALAAVELFATDKVRTAADYASAVVETVCTSPPTDVSTALATVGRAYAAVVTARSEP